LIVGSRPGLLNCCRVLFFLASVKSRILFSRQNLETIVFSFGYRAVGHESNLYL
jgi:hypothetical protein